MTTNNINNHPGFAIVTYALSLGTAVLYPSRAQADAELINILTTKPVAACGTVTKFYQNPLAVKDYQTLFILGEDYRLKGGDLTRENLRRVFGEYYDEHVYFTGYHVMVKMTQEIINLFLSWPS